MVNLIETGTTLILFAALRRVRNDGTSNSVPLFLGNLDAEGTKGEL